MCQIVFSGENTCLRTSVINFNRSSQVGLGKTTQHYIFFDEPLSHN